jgi:hypothetical protein
VRPLDALLLAVAGAVGALAVVLATGASLAFVLPVGILVAGIGYAITREPDGPGAPRDLRDLDTGELDTGGFPVPPR